MRPGAAHLGGLRAHGRDGDRGGGASAGSVRSLLRVP